MGVFSKNDLIFHNYVMKNVGYTSLARHMALTITAKYSRLSRKKHPAVLLLPPGYDAWIKRCKVGQSSLSEENSSTVTRDS